MTLETDLVVALQSATLNTTALSLLLSDARVEKYLPLVEKLRLINFVVNVGISLFAFARCACRFGSDRLDGVAIGCVVSVILYWFLPSWVLNIYRSSTVFAFELGKPLVPALLDGESIPLRELVTDIYDSGLTLQKISYDLYQDGMLFNYTTRLFAGDFMVANELSGIHDVRVEAFKASIEEVFRIT